MKATKNYLEQKFMIDVEQTQMFMNSFMSGFMAGQANTINKSLRKESNNKKALLDLNLFFRQNMMKILVETLKSILSIQDLMYKVGQETGRLTDIMGKSESIMGQVNLQYKPFIKKIEKLIKDDAKRKQIWLELKKDSFIEFLNSNLLQKKTQIQSLSRQISLSQNKYKKIVKQLRNAFQKKPSEPQKQRLKRVYSVYKDQRISLKKNQLQQNFKIVKKTSNSKQKHDQNFDSLPKIKTNYQTKFCQSLKPKKTEPKLKLDKSKPKEVKGKQQIKQSNKLMENNQKYK